MSASTYTVDAEALPPRPAWPFRLWGFCARQPLGAAGAFVVVTMVFLALFAEVVSPFDPEANDYEAMLVAPGWAHWFGTDQFGRDILTRIIYGAQTALFVGFVCAFVGATSGLILGVTSAYFGGDILTRIIYSAVCAP